MKKIRNLLVLTLVLILLTGCNLPVANDNPSVSPAEADDPDTPVSVGPLPPALVESQPHPGSRIGVGGEIHLYFNQPMDHDSVEFALSGDPALNGSFSWPDDQHLVFKPAEPWPPNTTLNLTIAPTAESQEALSLGDEVSLEFQTADYLRLVQSLPTAETVEIDPESAVVASFNQPVVPLGAALEEVPAGFSLSPAAAGRGEWLNTSTYVFYPAPALTGGLTYAVTVNPDLQSVDGTPLEEVDGWQFTTLPPAFESYSPRKDALHVRLDAPVSIVFNQAMDSASVEAAFSLVDEDLDPVSGQFEWTEDFKAMSFQPDELLRRGVRYTFVLPEGVLSSGGTPIANELRRSFRAVSDLFVLETDPVNGGLKESYRSVSISFNAPLASEDPGDFISVSPEVKFRTNFQPGADTLYLLGSFEADETYIVQVQTGLEDIWGGPLAYEYTFSFKGKPLDAAFRPALYQGSGAMFVNPDQPLVSAQVVNIDQVAVQTAPISFEEFLYYQHEAPYDAQPQPSAGQVLAGAQGLSIARNRNQVVGIELNSGKSLTPGLYWTKMDPIPGLSNSYQFNTFAVVSHVQLVLKFSAANALVWAIDTRSGAPVQNTPLQLISPEGLVLAEGETDGTGLFTAEIDPETRTKLPVYALLSEPGNEYFSMAKSDWAQGVNGWGFGVYANLRYPLTNVYLYTDRPIYRPGDEVSYRAVVREAYNGRYSLPDTRQITLAIRSSYGNQIEEVTIPLSEYGTASGGFILPEDAQPGYYEIYASGEDIFSGISFQVAEYRKPEIDLELAFSEPDYLAGEGLMAEVSARYFFDAPAAGNEIQWNIYADEGYFSLPGYRVGLAGGYSFNPYFGMGSDFGEYLVGDTGITGADGSYAVQYNSEPVERTMVYTLEATVRDESGQPVSSRASVTLHPDEVYIGVKADSWIGRVETETLFDIKVVDWARNSAAVRDLTVSIGEVTWAAGPKDDYGFPTYEKQVEVLLDVALQTSADGLLRFPFTPADPGVYQIEVRSGKAVTQYTLWVSGPGRALWPDFDQQKLELKTDQEGYQPGDVASVFIPNPFPGEALALVTQERGEILDQQIIKVADSGFNFPVSLSDDSAPNIYLTVTLLGTEEDGELGFRYGVVNLPVEPEALVLNVEVLGEPEKTAPGEPVELQVKVTDQSGNPVQGEFSVAVVDQAVLALADRFEQSIEDAYYGKQSLGVITGISLTADAELYFDLPGGLGGGGGGDMPPESVRDDFRDTAFWKADVVTNAEGLATLTLSLPDNLTTWQVLARGITKDSLVGEGVSEVITSKQLLIRPVTPRFVVAGDELELAAVVHNNTDEAIEAEVSLAAAGFELEDPEQARKTVEIKAGGRTKVTWWGTAGKADVLELVFSVQGGGLSDASEPTAGPIPVIGFTAPQSYLTAGALDEGGDRLELVSLPRSFDPAGGSLRLELSTSLAGVAFEGLEAMDSYYNHSNEYIVSSFLPNLELLLAIREFGLDEADLETQLEADLKAGVIKLQRYQNVDGGWDWYRGSYSSSNPTVSVYVLLGLVKAKDAGFEVNEYVIESGVGYLRGDLYNKAGSSNPSPWMFDRNVLQYYVLMEAGESLPDLTVELASNVGQMSPWAQALTGIILAEEGKSDEADTIFSNLQSTVARSATGVHWETEEYYWQSLSSSVTNNAIVIYALAQRDPASPVVTDAVRYLMSHRDVHGGWGSSYATSWAVLALTEVMRGTGELGGEFAFSASLNDNPFATGEAGGPEQFSQVVAETGLEDLLADLPNALKIQRDPGQGRLYYRAHLNVIQPVESIEGLNRGVGVSRAYYLAGQDCGDEACSPVTSAHVGDLLTVRVTVNLDQPLHYLTVRDYIPAGTEVLDLSLKTSQLGAAEQDQLYEPANPYAYGWGWWYFGASRVYDDHIVWTSDLLPAGTYELTYTLVVLQPGIFQAIPSQAQQIYFPEVQGISAGSVLEVLP